MGRKKLDKISRIARMKLAFLRKAKTSGDVAEWLKAAVC
jgi:hypothetical protein